MGGSGKKEDKREKRGGEVNVRCQFTSIVSEAEAGKGKIGNGPK